MRPPFGKEIPEDYFCLFDFLIEQNKSYGVEILRENKYRIEETITIVYESKE
jgi:hypothetical protein